jgi:hypothetical protein
VDAAFEGRANAREPDHPAEQAETNHPIQKPPGAEVVPETVSVYLDVQSLWILVAHWKTRVMTPNIILCRNATRQEEGTVGVDIPHASLLKPPAWQPWLPGPSAAGLSPRHTGDGRLRQRG